ncbi:ElyC/SanA/YdcF family protein [Geodermatophilus ruber]|uniref:DUF218 domain-containing protein n=1 Tax=Geodermatophilus ruber TaxID=504800 RepID=A0A1I4DHQ4_9ACTN|nr:ElyC/SanA/YdcF family protein [Geodermatophilus ruber]SFK92755.1 DUF218 domain-containing protein [Geodermatophilus ruber]
MTRLCSWVLATFTALALAAALVADLVLYPRVPAASAPADAVVILAGDADRRLPVARRLAESGPGVLVVSVSAGENNAAARALCAAPGALTVYCFTPTPPDTRGEGAAIGRLVDEQGWTRITVVTSTYHVSRARLTIGSCTDAELVMAQAPWALPLDRWLTQIAHEMGGLVETVLRRGC